MDKPTVIIILVSILLNTFLTFVWGEANILLIGNWALPFVILIICLVMARKINTYQKVLNDTNTRLDIIRSKINF
jgi:hypothetical protein